MKRNILKVIIFEDIKSKKTIKTVRIRFNELDSLIEKYNNNYMRVYSYSNYIGSINKGKSFIRKENTIMDDLNKIVIIRGYGDFDPNICTFYEKTLGKNAMKVIENHLKTQKEYDRSTYLFQVRTEDDQEHLYSYRNGKIIQKRG